MTRRAKYTWAAIVGLPLLALLGWCFWPFSVLDRSVLVSDRYVAIGGAVVENGSALDRAALDVAPYKLLVLPKAEGEELRVATFGEWDSHIEGGAFMGLLFVLPEGVEVRRRAGLSGGTAPAASGTGTT